MKNIVNKAKNEILNTFLPEDSAIDGYLYVMNKKYEVLAFETEFLQEEDYKGQPQHEVKGGLLSITLKQTSDEVLNRWMFQPDIAYSGTMVFASISRMATAPLTIAFTNGKCISFDKMIGSNIGVCITLLISPEMLTINEIDHSNAPHKINRQQDEKQ